jgi:hypothetical protein
MMKKTCNFPWVCYNFYTLHVRRTNCDIASGQAFLQCCKIEYKDATFLTFLKSKLSGPYSFQCLLCTCFLCFASHFYFVLGYIFRFSWTWNVYCRHIFYMVSYSEGSNTDYKCLETIFQRHYLYMWDMKCVKEDITWRWSWPLITGTLESEVETFREMVTWRACTELKLSRN